MFTVARTNGVITPPSSALVMFVDASDPTSRIALHTTAIDDGRSYDRMYKELSRMEDNQRVLVYRLKAPFYDDHVRTIAFVISPNGNVSMGMIPLALWGVDGPHTPSVAIMIDGTEGNAVIRSVITAAKAFKPKHVKNTAVVVATPLRLSQ